jgi:hypothetical protein
MSSPGADPLVTANLYCEGLQDAAIHGALAPFGAGLRQGAPDRAGFLWIVRYPRAGEHLKVRIHAPADQEPRLRELLRDSVDAWLATLPPCNPEQPERPRKDAPALPAIDPEDEAAAPWPDRSLVWTRYRRSHVSLGGGPFLADDLYVAHLTSSLGAGCEVVLDALVPDSVGKVSDSLRQTTLLQLLIGGLAAVGFGAEERAAYLAYHRDWLVRFSLVKGGGDAERTRELLARFNQRAEQMGASLGALRDAALATWGAPPDRDDRWQRALAELAGYVSRFRGNLDYRLDPFSEDPVFTPVFKVFHGMANQLGLGMLPEALTHHLLLRAVA